MNQQVLNSSQASESFYQETTPLFLEGLYHFTDLTIWDDELNRSAQSFKNQNGYWPNIMLASSITYRKVELVANTRPHQIKGDGSDGMPVNPEVFVSLTGFEGKNYSLEMCMDEQLAELSFKLIYDSDPDGGESNEDTDEILKAV